MKPLNLDWNVIFRDENGPPAEVVAVGGQTVAEKTQREIDFIKEATDHQLQAKIKRLESLSMNWSNLPYKGEKLFKSIKLHKEELERRNQIHLRKGFKGDICQICEAREHLADSCPFLYMRCKIPGCDGIKFLLQSQAPNNKGRMFLKCQYLSCVGFQWLDQAIQESKYVSGSSTTNPMHQSHGCFHCGSSEHRKRDCPWIASKCTNCHGVVRLKVPTKKHDEDRRFLSCERCGKFEWLNRVESSIRSNMQSSSGSMKMTIEGTVDDFYNMLKNNMKS